MTPHELATTQQMLCKLDKIAMNYVWNKYDMHDLTTVSTIICKILVPSWVVKWCQINADLYKMSWNSGPWWRELMTKIWTGTSSDNTFMYEDSAEKKEKTWGMPSGLSPQWRLEYIHYNRLMQEPRVKDENAFINFVQMLPNLFTSSLRGSSKRSAPRCASHWMLEWSWPHPEALGDRSPPPSTTTSGVGTAALVCSWGKSGVREGLLQGPAGKGKVGLGIRLWKIAWYNFIWAANKVT